MQCVRSVLLLGVLAAIAHAAQPQTSKERFETLLKEYRSAEATWSKRYEPGDRAANDESMIRYRDWPTWTFLPRFMELAEQDLKDRAALDALFWIVDQGQAVGPDDVDYYPYLEPRPRAARAR